MKLRIMQLPLPLFSYYFPRRSKCIPHRHILEHP